MIHFAIVNILYSSKSMAKKAGALFPGYTCLHNLYNLPSCRYVVKSSRSLYAVACPSVCLSVVSNPCARYSGGCNFSQNFYCIWYLGRPSIDIHKKFTGITPGERLLRGGGRLNTTGVAKYDFGPIESCISEMVEDRR